MIYVFVHLFQMYSASLVIEGHPQQKKSCRGGRYRQGTSTPQAILLSTVSLDKVKLYRLLSTPFNVASAL